MPRVFLCALLVFGLCSLFVASAAERAANEAANESARQWPDFRGPGQQGFAAGKAPLVWSEEKNVVWKTAIPGRGWSSPIIWDDQIWLTTATPDGKELFVVLVDRASGELLLHEKLFEVAEPQFSNALNSYASPSPVIEAGRVYVHFGTYGTACLDTATKKVVWRRRDLNIEHLMGPGASPVLYQHLLIIPCDGADQQYLIALDKATGETAWKIKRNFDYSALDPDICKAYATPLLVKINGRDELISTFAQSVISYNPLTGEEYWQVRYTGFSNVARPVVGNGMAFINTGYNRPELWAIRLGGSGDVTESHVAWRYDRSVPAMSSPALVDGLIYFVSDSGGILTCLDAATGEQVYNKRLSGNFSASPVIADGRIYWFDRDGRTTVMAPGREYKELAVNTLEDGCMATPAVLDGDMYLRSRTHLYRIEEGKESDER